MHLSFETALDLAEGTAGESEKLFWNKHLATCGECVTELEGWVNLAASVRGAHLVDAPQALIVSAKTLYEPEPQPSKVRDGLRQIIASLVFDSFAQPELAGVRAAIATEPDTIVRHLIWRAGELDLHVTISMFEDQRTLLGQILPRGDGTFISKARLHLRRGEERLGLAQVNDMGEFQFEDLPDGLLSLQIDLPHLTVISALVV